MSDIGWAKWLQVGPMGKIIDRVHMVQCWRFESQAFDHRDTNAVLVQLECRRVYFEHIRTPFESMPVLRLPHTTMLSLKREDVRDMRDVDASEALLPTLAPSLPSS